MSDTEAADALEALLGDAVARRLVADVPLGAFLSGGIDSSTIAAMMRAKSNAPVRTYSIGFNEAGYDEAPHARSVAAPSRHRAYRALCLSASRPRTSFPLCRTSTTSPSPIPRKCRPISCPSSPASTSRWRCRETGATSCSRATRGTGLRAPWRACPRAAGRGLACGLGLAGPALWDRVFSVLPAKRRPWLAGDKMLKASAMLRGGGQGAYRSLVSAWDEPERIVKQGRELQGPIFDPAIAEALPDGLDRMQYLDTLTYLPDDILTKVDRASMAVALEVRVPHSRSPRRRTFLAAAVALQDAARQGQMAAPPGAVPSRAQGSRRAAEDGLRHSHRELAQRAAQALGRGALVGEASCRRWTA